jgi:hypothetical protein
LINNVATLTANVATIGVKLHNSFAVDPDDILVPVLNAAGGAVPGVFPLTRGAFHALTANSCNILFGYYGIAAPAAGVNINNRRKRLRPLLGLSAIHSN